MRLRGPVRGDSDDPPKASQPKLDDFFAFDFRGGSIINRLTEERVQVVPTLRWKTLQDDLTLEFHEQAPLIIARFSAIMGASMADNIMKNLGDPVSLARNIADLSAAAGWGVFVITGDTRYGSSYAVTVTNCVFCEKEDLSDSPRCDFLVGVIKGMADFIYGTPHKVWEESCGASGHAICQFKVEECHDPALCSSCRNLRYCRLSESLVKQTSQRPLATESGKN